jgi:hypothetical protein
MSEKETRVQPQSEDPAGKDRAGAKDLGRPAEADAQQNKAPSEVGPATEEKKRAREEFNLHEADLGRNPQG